MGRIYRGADPEERSAQRRAKLLDAGLQLFGTRGYESTKIEQLCAEASVSTRNFYEHFSNKEALLAEVHDIANNRILDEVGATMRENTDTEPLERLAEVTRTAFFVMTSDPRLPRIVFVEAQGVGETLRERYQSYLEKWTELIDAELTESARRGTIVARNFRLQAAAITAMVAGMLRYWQNHDLDAEDVVSEIVEIVHATAMRS